jgi:ParB-like chromosome segregation protein Spo0J
MRTAKLHVTTSPEESMKKNPADKVESWPIDKLVPYARNARTHSDAQVAQLAASITEWGWTTPILVEPAGGVIAGHGRLMAARKLGMTHVPVMVADGWSEAQRRAYVLADNKLARNAGWDDELLQLELGELGELGFDLELAGFDLGEIEKSKDDEPARIDDNTQLSIMITFSCETDLQAAFALCQENGWSCKIIE